MVTSSMFHKERNKGRFVSQEEEKGAGLSSEEDQGQVFVLKRKKEKLVSQEEK